MRFLTYILSFYIIVLTAIPCIEHHVNYMQNKVEISQAAASSQDNDTDHCSPFCTCCCCSLPIVSLDRPIVLSCYYSLQWHYSEYLSHDVTSPCSSIWQPPQLS